MALRKGLGDRWSVTVVALPEEGKAQMEKWFASEDKDVRGGGPSVSVHPIS